MVARIWGYWEILEVWCGLNGGPPNMSMYLSPELVNIALYGKRCDLVKDFEMKRLSWIIWIGPKCHHMYPYQTDTQGKTAMWRRRQSLE